MSYRRYSVLCFAALGAIAGCADGAAPASADGPASEGAAPLIGAPIDEAHTFSVGVCGGAINADPSAGPVGTCQRAGRRCTGTLVAPNLVLTARHCVDDFEFNNADFCENTFSGTPNPPEEVFVTLGPSVIEGAPAWLPVKKVILPEGANNCDDDVALLQLKRNVPSRAATPVDVDIRTDVARDPPGAIAIVGRGVVDIHFDPATGATTVDQGGLRRRILENIPFVCASNVDDTCTVVDSTSPPSNSFSLPASLLLAGAASGPGDSGAAFFDQGSFDAGRPKVVAVDTLGTFDLAGEPNASIGIRVSRHAFFLAKAALQAARAGSYPPPRWVFGDDR